MPKRESMYDMLMGRVEKAKIAPALCVIDQAVIRTYRSGQITSEEMTTLLAHSQRKKVELVLREK